jgi:hypothetical protein
MLWDGRWGFWVCCADGFLDAPFPVWVWSYSKVIAPYRLPFVPVLALPFVLVFGWLGRRLCLFILFTKFFFF